MGWRFHKSKKIAPGVRINFNKKSFSVTLGDKGIHRTISSNGKTTHSIGIPGTGLYYTSTSTNSSKNSGDIENNMIGSSNSVPPDPPKKKTSCLGCLGYFFVILLAIALFRILWIACIPVIIYLIKHKDRKKRKLHLVISFIILLMSICVFCTSFIPINSISINSKSVTLDINSSKDLAYEFDPAASLNKKFEFISDNDDIVSISKSENDVRKVMLKSKKVSGSTIVYIRDKKSNVVSNKVKVTVIDKDAIKKEKQEKIAEQQKKEKQKQIAEQQKKEKQTATEQKEPTTTEQEKQATTEQKEQQVWISSTGTKYHSDKYCSNMDNPSQVSLSNAKNRGYTACKRCY